MVDRRTWFARATAAGVAAAGASVVPDVYGQEAGQALALGAVLAPVHKAIEAAAAGIAAADKEYRFGACEKEFVAALAFAGICGAPECKLTGPTTYSADQKQLVLAPEDAQTVRRYLERHTEVVEWIDKGMRAWHGAKVSTVQEMMAWVVQHTPVAWNPVPWPFSILFP